MTTTITTEQEQWAAAINAGCDSLTLLAYADWLEERGDETARAWRWFATVEVEPARPIELRDGAYAKERHGGSLSFDAKTDPENRRGVTLPLSHAEAVDFYNKHDVSWWHWGMNHTRFAAYVAAARALCETYPVEIPRP